MSLRYWLEKSALPAPRMQLTMQRLLLQEQKVARLAKQLDETRKQTSTEDAGHAKVTEELNEAGQISGQMDAARRKSVEAG